VVSGDGGRGLPEHRHTPSARSRPPACPGGDHIYKMDYGPLLAMHVSSGADVTVGCMPVPLSETSSFGIMEIDEHNPHPAIYRKPSYCDPMPGHPDMALASMGIYVFNTRYLLSRLLVDANKPGSSHDFGKILSLRPSKTARSLLTCSARTTAPLRPTGEMWATSTPTGKPTWN